MQVSYIREFIVFAGYLSYAPAARDLYISQQTLCNHIASMEADLGFRLVERDDGRIGLTPQGRRFLDGVQPIHEEFEELVRQCRASAQATLRMARFPMGHEQMLLRAARRYREQTGTQVDLVYVDSNGDDPAGAVREGVLDFALLAVPVVDGRDARPAPSCEGLAAELLFHDRLGFWVDAASSFGEGGRARAADLDGMEFPTSGRPQYIAFCEELRAALASCGIGMSYRVEGLATPEDDFRFFPLGAMVGVSNRRWVRATFGGLDEFRVVEVDDCPVSLNFYLVYDPGRLSAAQLGFLREATLDAEGGRSG